jgi:hypothetical protein
MIARDFFYILLVLPPFFLVIFLLYMTFRNSKLVAKSVENVERDRPKDLASGKAFLSMFYLLDETKGQKKNKLIWSMGAVGAVGTTFLFVVFLVIYYLGYAFLPR